MLLDFSGSEIQFTVDDESSSISKHTGALLRVLRVRTTVRGETANSELMSLIDQAKTDGVASVGENGETQVRWKIGNTSWNYREGSPTYQHTLELTEVEILKLSSLTIGHLTVQPYKYEETIEDDLLNIEANVILSEAQHHEMKAIQKNNDYFPVVRHGINDVARQMRFGIGYWSQHNTEYRHQLVLVEEKKETRPSPLSSVFRWIRSVRDQVADNTVAIESLFAALQSKNILTEEEVASIRKDLSERSWDVLYGFFRVEDVDDL